MNEFLSLTYSQELLPIAERKEHPTELLDSLTTHAPPGYTLTSTDGFISSVVEDMVRYPDDSHVIIAGGDSGNGKTVTLQEIIVEIVKNNTCLQENLKKLRRSVVVAGLSWGMAKTLSVELGDYHRYSDRRPPKIKETSYRSISLYLGFREWTTRQYDRAIKLAFMDMPIITGTQLDENESHEEFQDAILGIPRGESLVRDIFNPLGPFSNVNVRAHFFGISASPQVRDHALSNRAIAMQDLPLEAILEQLSQKGFDPGTSDEIAIREYFTEVATPDQMRLVHRDIDEVINGLIALNILDNPANRDINVTGDHPYFQNSRHNFIVQEVFPYFIRKMGIPPERATVFANEEIQDIVHAYVSIATERPLEGIFTN